MRVALVYDRVNKWGGAERVLLALHKLFPGAPLYTSVYNPETAEWAKVFLKVIPSFLQNFPFAKTRHDLYAPLMPLAFESFDFSEFDLVISVTSEAAKGIITSPKTKHLCYMLTPTRYLWSGFEEYFNTSFKQSIAKSLLNYLKRWDKIAARRPDKIIAISKTVANRATRYYERDPQVIHPPVNHILRYSINPGYSRHARFDLAKLEGKYYLVVSRLVPYKKVDLVVDAFNEMSKQLVIVGTGSEEKSLRKQSKYKNIHFVGQVSDKELISYYKGCKALIFPQEEDFGIVAVEAQLFGKPVIAYKAGGATEIVKDGLTGLFFTVQDKQSLINATNKFEQMNFKSNSCRKNAERFSFENFKRNFLQEVENLLN